MEPPAADRVDSSGLAPPGEQVEPSERVDLLMRDLRTSPLGLSNAEAGRRLIQYGPNELQRRGGLQWPRELARQLTHPLALLLWLAAALSFAVGSQTVAIAVLLVIVLNALFAFAQEMQAERAVEALAQFLPQQVRVLRERRAVADRRRRIWSPATSCIVEEGDRVAADMRLISGAVEVDLSTLTGESAPAVRAADLLDASVPTDRGAGSPLQRYQRHRRGGSGCRVRDRDAHRAGTHSGAVRAREGGAQSARAPGAEGRMADRRDSDRDGRRVRSAWRSSAPACRSKNSVVFAVGLLAGNVPEGLLPVITLALAVAVRALARRGALVKRLSAVETLGSTDVDVHRQDRNPDREPHEPGRGLDAVG